MSLKKTNNFLTMIVSLIAIFTFISSIVTSLMPSDRSPAPRPTPSEEVASNGQGKKPTTSNEPSGSSQLDAPLPFSARAARLVKIINFSAGVFTILLLPVLLIGMAMWPPPETPWVTVVSGFGVLGSVLVLIYGVLTLVVGTCAGVMDWPSTIALLVAIPVSILDLILGGIVDQRNVNPDNLAFAQRERHRARYTRKA